MVVPLRLGRLTGSLAAALVASMLPTALAATIQSRDTPGVQIDYKETTICETTPGVKGYAGYITLPAGLDPTAQYDSHMFFWFFEARQNPKTAPVTLWVQGGPGAATMDQVVSGHNGPCIVQSDSRTTVVNPWSWNKASNMLYIDQPTQTGFTYDEVTPGVLDLLDGGVFPPGSVNETNTQAFLKGFFPSQNSSRVAATTGAAGRAVALFLQMWFDEFDDYSRDNVNVWSQSYGGHWAPSIATHILAANNNNSSSSSSNSSSKIGVKTVGIINGFIDVAIHMESYPKFAQNNTYGIRLYDSNIADAALKSFNEPQTGCKALIAACNHAAAAKDPEDAVPNQDVIALCVNATNACNENVYQPVEVYSGRDPFDIIRTNSTFFPPMYAEGYLNRDDIREALGAKVNYTDTSNPVLLAFFQSGDFIRDTTSQIGQLLDQGVAVSLMNGDRDFKCNWPAGEAISLAIKYKQASSFAAAGYSKLQTNDSYVGGMVRQYGKFSFTRVYQAGHEVPAYQPETAYQIFARTLAGQDIATGKTSIVAAGSSSTFASSGPASIFDQSDASAAGAQPADVCYTHMSGMARYCAPNQVAALQAGTAEIKDFVVVQPSPSWPAGPRGQATATGTATASGTGTGTAGGPSPSKTPGNGAGRMGAGRAGLAGVVILMVLGLW